MREAAQTIAWQPVGRPRTEDPDRPSVAAAAAGDLQAFEALFQRHHRRILNLTSRFLERPEDAEEAVTDTFVRAYRALKSFRGDARFSTWLHRIAVNVCLRRQRQGQAPQDEYQDANDEENGSNFADQTQVESLVEARDRRRAVRRAVHSLSSKLRPVVVLHFFHDMTCEEISEVLGCSVGTVWSRLHAARQKLAQLLEKELFE